MSYRNTLAIIVCVLLVMTWLLLRRKNVWQTALASVVGFTPMLARESDWTLFDTTTFAAQCVVLGILAQVAIEQCSMRRIDRIEEVDKLG